MTSPGVAAEIGKPALRNILRWVRRIWITVGLSATAVFVIWSVIAYRASSQARMAVHSDSTVSVRHADGMWHFEPTGRAESTDLLFIPGALVDPKAYAPLARAAARNGYGAMIVEVPRRGAFGGADSPELDRRIAAVLALHGDSQRIVVAGHSRGAVIASRIAFTHAAAVDGLVLIGTSHPRDQDLSSLTIPVTKIVGTRDGLASPAEVRDNADLLPPQTRWIWIEGGNHSQFGWYGFQPLDRLAQIDAGEQRRIMTRGVLDMLQAVDSSDDTRSLISDPLERQEAQ